MNKLNLFVLLVFCSLKSLEQSDKTGYVQIDQGKTSPATTEVPEDPKSPEQSAILYPIQEADSDSTIAVPDEKSKFGSDHDLTENDVLRNLDPQGQVDDESRVYENDLDKLKFLLLELFHVDKNNVIATLNRGVQANQSEVSVLKDSFKKNDSYIRDLIAANHAKQSAKNYKIANNVDKLIENYEKRINEVGKSLENLQKLIDKVSNDENTDFQANNSEIVKLKSEFITFKELMNQQIEQINKKFEQTQNPTILDLQASIKAINETLKKFESLEKRINELEHTILTMQNNVNTRFQSLIDRLNKLESHEEEERRTQTIIEKLKEKFCLCSLFKCFNHCFS